tara:strand:- start:8270 stop:9118 length:849 start_codon:yes stop_codon:yes gene_type:complete
MSYIPRLKNEYKTSIVDKLVKEFSYDNVMQVPKLEKIVISKGVGAAVNDKKLIDHAINEISEISGQRAIATISKKDVASFKLRKGMPIGVKVTLRGENMYEFLDRLVTTALPRVRDFNGVKSTGFDGRGNYNLGITEQIIFPEINIDKINKISGMDITFVTSAKSDKEALQLLSELGLPFKRKSNEVIREKTLGKVVSKNPDISEDTAALEEAPVSQEAPAADEAPVSEEVPVADEAPVSEEVPVADEAPVSEDASVVEEGPDSEETKEEEESESENENNKE